MAAAVDCAGPETRNTHAVRAKLLPSSSPRAKGFPNDVREQDESGKPANTMARTVREPQSMNLAVPPTGRLPCPVGLHRHDDRVRRGRCAARLPIALLHLNDRHARRPHQLPQLRTHQQARAFRGSCWQVAKGLSRLGLRTCARTDARRGSATLLCQPGISARYRNRRPTSDVPSLNWPGPQTSIATWLSSSCCGGGCLRWALAFATAATAGASSSVCCWAGMAQNSAGTSPRFAAARRRGFPARAQANKRRESATGSSGICYVCGGVFTASEIEHPWECII